MLDDRAQVHGQRSEGRRLRQGDARSEARTAGHPHVGRHRDQHRAFQRTVQGRFESQSTASSPSATRSPCPSSTR
ncbi:MAG: hypothetical protein MZU97_17495 [Bacillus subtilis]|nr:hypothetical protein [Bacillus subtilis]